MSEPMTNVCPVCSAKQDAGLMCSSCCDRLEHALGAVPGLVRELATTAAKMAKIGNPSSGGGLARERSPINWGAVEAADNLENVLTTWAREVAPGSKVDWAQDIIHRVSAEILLWNIDTIRRHPAVAELVDEITDAVEQARRAIDRPQDRMYLGQCATVLPGPDDVDVECYAEIWGRPDATEINCRVCGYAHHVLERRKWLVARAADMVVTAKQASLYLADVGQLDVSETSIRNWVGRGKVLLRPGLSTQRQFELGALMDYIAKRDMQTQLQGVA